MGMGVGGAWDEDEGGLEMGMSLRQGWGWGGYTEL